MLDAITPELVVANAKRDAAYMAWEAAVRTNSGAIEGQLRIQLHAYLDQILDLRVRSLQLIIMVENQ